MQARNPLKVGLFLPHGERQLDRATPRWADIRAMAERAEQVGFDSLWVSDHLIFENRLRFGPALSIGFWECWSLLSALAASTRRVEIGPLVSPTSFRNPALLAKMAATVDEISGGRLILGLGAGWRESEYRAFGYPYDHRYSRFEEALTIIQGLLRDGRVDFNGRYERARDCELRPRGPRPQGPPIMIGTRGERMIRLAAERAAIWNAWLVFGSSRPEALDPLLAQLDAACREAGRDPKTLARTVAVMAVPPGLERGLAARLTDRFEQAVARRFGLRPEPLAGPPAALAQSLDDFAARGVSHIQVMLRPNSLAAIEAFAPVLEMVKARSQPGAGSEPET